MRATVLAIALLSTNAFAGAEPEFPAPKISARFESLKRLVGTWEGTSKMDGTDQPIKITYELTSGGTALVEKLMPGTPEEMITVYANNGDQVNVTHFCMVGNQPQMKLRKAEGDVFQFEMDGTKGIANKNDMHMHALTLTLHGNSLKQEWTNYKDNKKGESMVFEFTKRIIRRYPALMPFLHLDYIYFDGLRLRDAFFHHTPAALLASDHVPLVADFAW